MTVLSFINLKGGVAKTVSAINTAYLLAAVEKKKVLLIDNDKQGNATKFFGLHDYDRPSIADLLTVKGMDASTVIRHTAYENLDLIPSNMSLLKANKEVLMDCSRASADPPGTGAAGRMGAIRLLRHRQPAGHQYVGNQRPSHYKRCDCAGED